MFVPPQPRLVARDNCGERLTITRKLDLSKVTHCQPQYLSDYYRYRCMIGDLELLLHTNPIQTSIYILGKGTPDFFSWHQSTYLCITISLFFFFSKEVSGEKRSFLCAKSWIKKQKFQKKIDILKL